MVQQGSDRARQVIGGGLEVLNRRTGRLGRTADIAPPRTISQFLSQIAHQVEVSRGQEIADALDERIHPRVNAVWDESRGRVNIIAPLLPVHEIIPQRFLRPRAKSRVWVEGRGIYQSFYNPIRSGHNFIVAWYRHPPVKRLPISFVMRDPTPYIRRRIRSFLNRGGALEPYERIFQEQAGRFGEYTHLDDDIGDLRRQRGYRSFRGAARRGRSGLRGAFR